MRNRLHSWNIALVTLVLIGLTGALVFVASSDASAKRKKPKKNQSPADFSASYSPPESFRCSYVEKWDRIEVEDWLCTTDKDSHRAILFYDMLTVGAGEGGSWWDDQGWKYLAAPKRFNCALREGETDLITQNYDCTYWDQGKKHVVPLSNTMLATSDAGTKWYLQRLPYPPNPSPLPTP